MKSPNNRPQRVLLPIPLQSAGIKIRASAVGVPEPD